MSGTMTGPLAIFLQALAFVLVLASLFVMVHALGRRVERWTRPWVRWVWAALAAEYVVAFAALFVFRRSDTAVAVFGISYIAAVALDVAYLLRVVFPPAPRREEPPGEPVAVGAPVAPDAGSPAQAARERFEEDA
ncbi:MAG: hypothetical protein N3B11_04255 [Coriobacteriia bacterium]|nr:hypothetical protein [Coriobacteriia bacterium]